ncbi:MAG: hypothetical protein P8J32_02890 [bacterium]|nr:hypothetical protein [bacterium]
MGSGFDTIVPGIYGRGEIEIVTHLDATELLGDRPRSRQVQTPAEIVQAWNLPIVEGDQGALIPVIGVRLLLVEKRPAPEIGGKEEYVWEVLITPFRDDALRRWISHPKNLIVTDETGERLRGSFHMGEEVRRLAHQLSKLRPPELAVFEVYFHLDRNHTSQMEGVASSSKLSNRNRGRLLNINRDQWKRWRKNAWNWLWHRNTSEAGLQKKNLGPGDLITVPVALEDKWHMGGGQSNEILRVMTDFELVLGSIWRANFWSNERLRTGLQEQGWNPNAPRETIIPESPNAQRIIRKQSRLRSSTVSDQRLASIVAARRRAS